MDTLSYKTISAKAETVQKEWVVVDATDQVLGRLCSKVAKILRGKYKPCFTPHVDCGDNVIIINADKVVVSGNKGQDMLYRHYTGYVGGLKSESFDSLIARKPTEPLRKTVWGMLPHNRLGRKLAGYVKIYAGSEHPHVAQNPKPLEV